MYTQLPQHSSRNINVRDILNERMDFYSVSPAQRTRIIERTIVTAADDPDLLTGSPIEASLLRLLHQILRAELCHEQGAEQYVGSLSRDQNWLR